MNGPRRLLDGGVFRVDAIHYVWDQVVSSSSAPLQLMLAANARPEFATSGWMGYFDLRALNPIGGSRSLPDADGKPSPWLRLVRYRRLDGHLEVNHDGGSSIYGLTLWSAPELPLAARPLSNLSEGTVASLPTLAEFEESLLRLCELLQRNLADPCAPRIELAPGWVWIASDGLSLLNAGLFEEVGRPRPDVMEREGHYHQSLPRLIREYLDCWGQQQGLPKRFRELIPPEFWDKLGSGPAEIERAVRGGHLRLNPTHLSWRHRILQIAIDAIGQMKADRSPKTDESSAIDALERLTELLNERYPTAKPGATVTPEAALEQIEQMLPALLKRLREARRFAKTLASDGGTWMAEKLRNSEEKQRSLAEENQRLRQQLNYAEEQSRRLSDQNRSLKTRLEATLGKNG